MARLIPDALVGGVSPQVSPEPHLPDMNFRRMGFSLSAGVQSPEIKLALILTA